MSAGRASRAPVAVEVEPGAVGFDRARLERLLTQLLPWTTHPLRPRLRQLVYQALVD